jgi:hypothetical protein
MRKPLVLYHFSPKSADLSVQRSVVLKVNAAKSNKRPYRTLRQDRALVAVHGDVVANMKGATDNVGVPPILEDQHAG